MNLNIRWDLVTGTVVGIGTAVIGGWDIALKVLLILMGADVVTGLLKALMKGDYTSREFRKGLVSKAGFFIVLILCYQVDLIVNAGNPMLRDVATIFYIAIEGSSIIENLGVMGVPIPNAIKNRLAVLKSDNEKNAMEVVKDDAAKVTKIAETLKGTEETAPIETNNIKTEE